MAKAECPNQFANSGSRVSAGGIMQGGSDPQKAVDGNFGSSALLYGAAADTGTDAAEIYSAPASVLDLVVTAASGLSFPAGNRAGAVAQLASGPAVQQQVTVITYLGGVVQEAFDGGLYNSITAPTSSQVFSYLTTKAYDSVRFSILLSSPASTERPQVKVYEFCG
ncbi:hypothetical protein ED208_15735 [Stagnimonas aquatica]|uniref:Uncharacterized protein n=1 Tax=Stagnimonas aquatica TaxID=2689987 RepID=A0A3N0V199_9GAMM|nr:hypothetical protein ED208_15735 [Stagnimonas aquatica]